METRRAILNELERAQRILLFGHRDPDGDSAGSILALAEALSHKTVYCYSEGRLPQRYHFLDPHERLHNRPDPDFAPDLAVAMECPTRSRLGAGLDMLRPTTRLVNIDHHRDNEIYGEINWIEPQAAALGEMIYELICTSGQSLNEPMASALYTAILTDTGRFHFRGTSARSLKICSHLVECGADPNAITQHVYFGLPPSYLRLMHAALDSMESAADGRILAFTLLPEHFERAGAEPQDSEGIVDLSLVSDRARIGLLFRQPQPGQIKISLRSQDAIDVGALAAQWGGGGHRNAAGCLIEGSMEHVKAQVLERAEALLEAAG